MTRLDPGHPLLLLLAGFLALSSLMPAAAMGASSDDPIRVVHRVTIRSGDWVPLPPEDMRRAAADTALSRLSDAGRLQLVDRDQVDLDDPDSLALELSLIGPAETAKLTITLDVQNSPTLVSTASISVRGLDHAGIHAAFEHVGELAADRLAAKLDFLRGNDGSAGLRPNRASDDPARRRIYDEAQSAKRAGRYDEARGHFEAVVESAASAEDALRLLAEDELRYGLPLFEAQQALNQLGRMSLPGQEGRRDASLARAENLYRQIQAENPSNVQRVMDAQRALDNLIVVRGAIRNAMRAQALSGLQSVRMAMMEFYMMEGECPDGKWVDGMSSGRRSHVALDKVIDEGAQNRRYVFTASTSDTRVALRCSVDGIEIVEVDDLRRGAPAAAR